jgi:hypothetical protein
MRAESPGPMSSRHGARVHDFAIGCSPGRRSRPPLRSATRCRFRHGRRTPRTEVRPQEQCASFDFLMKRRMGGDRQVPVSEFSKARQVRISDPNRKGGQTHFHRSWRRKSLPRPLSLTCILVKEECTNAVGYWPDYS